jgi:hypothetical protein
MHTLLPQQLHAATHSPTHLNALTWLHTLNHAVALTHAHTHTHTHTHRYEYYERRFCRAIRTAAAFAFVLKTVLYLAVVLYAPALTLSTLTNVPETGTTLPTYAHAHAQTHTHTHYTHTTHTPHTRTHAHTHTHTHTQGAFWLLAGSLLRTRSKEA